MNSKISLDINNIPAEWSIIPCGVFFREKSIKNTAGEINLSVYRDYGVIPRDSRDDNHNRVSEDTSNYKLVESGDFVLNKMKGWMGSLGVSDYRGIVSPSYTVMEPAKEIHNKYFHYLLRSEPYRQIYESLSYGVRIGQWELRYHDFKQIPALYPPLQEQKLISRFLDKKTGQIDSMVEKLQRKIELLKEQRTALINQCVTKGLNPNVEMKDSGIEWIGAIPAHWRISRIKFIGDTKSGDGFKVELQGDSQSQIPFYKVSDTNNVGNEKYLSVSNNYITQEIVYSNKFQLFPKDTIVFPKLGAVLKLNKRRITTTTCCIDNNMMGFMVNSDDKLEYLYFYLLLVNFDLYCSDGTIPSISETQVGMIPVLIPPIDEQYEIAKYLKQKTQTLGLLVEKEKQRCLKLSEYRQSLISAAVTGKIRVTEGML